ncbi:uncharacterized protein TM35_000441040 [Trypanosoma theileri]|uniref:Uncharacterized protein n=1 Tax=Trypanosoma theileri TaxID=67003 RepID=A0A1X0NIU3_9TRYP|nr:uncharacterized protein TM35_000441040 [Trypanosoma theileri]ORC84448.1 hypothetical protein TM35_000441040 [Trypanosoma theileri]
MRGNEKSAEHQSGDSTTLNEALLSTLLRENMYKLQPWRQQADEYSRRYDDLFQRVEKPEIHAILVKTFEERMKSNMPLSQDVAFILMTLLYSGSNHPHLVLADMLLNMSPDDRRTMHNWAVYRDANDFVKESMATAIASGKLAFPLFPGTEMDTQNRCLIEDAMGAKRLADMGEKTMEGGGPSETNEFSKKQTGKSLYSRSDALYDQSPHATKSLCGGEPFIPVFDGNNNQAGYWDGAPVKERFDQLYKEIQYLRSELKGVRASANNGGGNYAGRSNGSNRRGRGVDNGQRGGRRSGRGGGYNYGMHGGNADYIDEDLYTTHETNVEAKN